jgi:hypothetical protein
MLGECLADLEKHRSGNGYAEERLRELYRFFETTTGWYARVRGWPTATLVKFMRASDRALKLLGLSA